MQQYLLIMMKLHNYANTQADNTEGVALYADDMVMMSNFVTWNKNNMEQLCHKVQTYHWTNLLQGTNIKHWTTLLRGKNIKHWTTLLQGTNTEQLCYMVQT